MPDLIVAVRSLGRLETESYHLECVVDLTDYQTQLVGLVKAKDAILFVAVGAVVAGVDLEQIAPSDVDTDWIRRSVTDRETRSASSRSPRRARARRCAW